MLMPGFTVEVKWSCGKLVLWKIRVRPWIS